METKWSGKRVCSTEKFIYTGNLYTDSYGNKYLSWKACELNWKVHRLRKACSLRWKVLLREELNCCSSGAFHAGGRLVYSSETFVYTEKAELLPSHNVHWGGKFVYGRNHIACTHPVYEAPAHFGREVSTVLQLQKEGTENTGSSGRHQLFLSTQNWLQSDYTTELVAPLQSPNFAQTLKSPLD